MLTELDQAVDDLLDLARDDRAAFDQAVVGYVRGPAYLAPVFRDPAVVEDTLDALDRILDRMRAERAPKRALAPYVSERKAVRRLAGNERQLRLREEMAEQSPRSRAARRLADGHCAHCGHSLVPQFLTLVREEKQKAPAGLVGASATD